MLLLIALLACAILLAYGLVRVAAGLLRLLVLTARLLWVGLSWVSLNAPERW